MQNTNEGLVFAKIRREQLKLTQAQMAKILGVSTRVYSNIECNTRPLRFGERKILNEFFQKNDINLSQEIASYPGPTQVRVTILVTKQFSSVSEEQMQEILEHLRVIRAAITPLEAGWEVTCDKIL